ncbi:hypothetical protein ACFQUU_06175 [Herbaspirillum sp. GCM10030257]|uniref:hypothetical protein n=1 Tax=Herbaspirillum sp. GCM10030257 TaxID=3273393 RepID=UPI0036199C3F
MSANPLFLSNEEIFAIVHPLTQPAAIVRWFKHNRFTDVKVRPNGMPLIARAYFDQVTPGKRLGCLTNSLAQGNRISRHSVRSTAGMPKSG